MNLFPYPRPVLLALAVGMACFPDGVDPPNGGEPPDFDLTGTWSYDATFLGGSEGSCFVRDLTISFVQQGAVLTGSTQGGVAECSFLPDVDLVEPLPDMPLRDGQVSIETGTMIVSFGEGQRWRHAGLVRSEDLLQGTTDLTYDFGGEVGEATFMDGTWTASRLTGP